MGVPCEVTLRMGLDAHNPHHRALGAVLTTKLVSQTAAGIIVGGGWAGRRRRCLGALRLCTLKYSLFIKRCIPYSGSHCTATDGIAVHVAATVVA